MRRLPLISRSASVDKAWSERSSNTAGPCSALRLMTISSPWSTDSATTMGCVVWWNISRNFLFTATPSAPRTSHCNNAPGSCATRLTMAGPGTSAASLPRYAASYDQPADTQVLRAGNRTPGRFMVAGITALWTCSGRSPDRVMSSCEKKAAAMWLSPHKAMRKPWRSSMARRKNPARCPSGGRWPSGSSVATSSRAASTSSISGCTSGSSVGAAVGGVGLGRGLGRQTRSGTTACAATSSVITVMAWAWSAARHPSAHAKSLSW